MIIDTWVVCYSEHRFSRWTTYLAMSPEYQLFIVF